MAVISRVDQWLCELAVEIWPRVNSCFDISQSHRIICLTANLVLPECVSHNTPFSVRREKTNCIFFPHLIKEIIQLRKYDHFSTVLSWGGGIFFLFLYWAGARTTVRVEVVTFNLHSIAVSIAAWFWFKSKVNTSNSGTNWSCMLPDGTFWGNTAWLLPHTWPNVYINQRATSHKPKFYIVSQTLERSEVAKTTIAESLQNGEITSRCNTESQIASKKQKETLFFCARHTSRGIRMKWVD